MFKKSATGPKIGETYATTSTTTTNQHHHRHQLNSDHSSSIELYSDGRCDDFIESSNYQMQPDTGSPNMLINRSPLDHHHLSNRSRDHHVRWSSHFSSEDPFNFNTNPSFLNCGSNISYPPSKVIILCTIRFYICFSSLILRQINESLGLHAG